jgi:hypothetical protein
MSRRTAPVEEPLDLTMARNLWCKRCHGSLSDVDVLARHLRTCARKSGLPVERHLFWPRTPLQFPTPPTPEG